MESFSKSSRDDFQQEELIVDPILLVILSCCMAEGDKSTAEINMVVKHMSQHTGRVRRKRSGEGRKQDRRREVKNEEIFI